MKSTRYKAQEVFTAGSADFEPPYDFPVIR
jgi:hypothetical protein